MTEINNDKWQQKALAAALPGRAQFPSSRSRSPVRYPCPQRTMFKVDCPSLHDPADNDRNVPKQVIPRRA
jgi:hypothetical protein